MKVTMLDPTKITKFNATKSELEEMILFWICAAGKNGVTAARSLDKLLLLSLHGSPFDKIIEIAKKSDLSQKMKSCGIGCYNRKATTFLSLIDGKLNLKTCSVDDLEKISGIGPKTARCFLIHSRPNQQLAGLDTHILKFLRDQGLDVPKTTPTGKKYKEIEAMFLKYVKKSGMSVADFDLKVWNEYRSKQKNNLPNTEQNIYIICE